MNRPHVFVDASDFRADGATLRGDVAHHLLKVLRRDVGDDQRARSRWQAVARAAAEQSGRARLPHVAQVTTWTQAFADTSQGVVVWEETLQPLRAVAFADGAEQVAVGGGPEGGLTAEEVTTAGLPAVSLGTTILRTDTAGVVASALVLHRLGRLG